MQTLVLNYSAGDQRSIGQFGLEEYLETKAVLGSGTAESEPLPSSQARQHASTQVHLLRLSGSRSSTTPTWSGRRRLYRRPAVAGSARRRSSAISRATASTKRWDPGSRSATSSPTRSSEPRRNGIAYDPALAQRIYDDIPNWKPHGHAPAAVGPAGPRVPARRADQLDGSQIMSNMDQFGVPFHAIVTPSGAVLQARA